MVGVQLKGEWVVFRAMNIILDEIHGLKKCRLTNVFNWPQAMNFNTFFYEKSLSLLFAMINHGPGS